MKRRTVKQRLRVNHLWQENQLALLRDTHTNTKGVEVKLIPDIPNDPTEAERWYEGVAIFDKCVASMAPTTAEPQKVNWDNAPESVKAEQQAAKDRAEAARIEAEVAQLQEQTRASELEAAELRGQIKGRSERKAA